MWEVEEMLHDDLLDRTTLGSARVSRAGFGVAPKQSFEPWATRGRFRASRKVHDGEDALANTRDACAPQKSRSPLEQMTLPERVRADYETMNLTTGPHPMKLLRESLPNIWRAIDLVHAPHRSIIQIAGNVICRQRPGTAKGFVFISLEDETGVSNAIVEPNLFERFRLLITEEAFLLIEGQVQNSDNVVLIKAREIRSLAHEQLVGSESHDFH
jgi:error-prone DNA polymerase